MFTTEETDSGVDAYNEAVRLARSGDLAGAATRLEALAKDCTGEAVCEKARETAAQMRQALAKKERATAYNRAVDLLNDGKRKEAIALLRQLEKDATDPEFVARVQELLKKLGQKPAR